MRQRVRENDQNLKQKRLSMAKDSKQKTWEIEPSAKMRQRVRNNAQKIRTFCRNRTFGPKGSRKNAGNRTLSQNALEGSALRVRENAQRFEKTFRKFEPSAESAQNLEPWGQEGRTLKGMNRTLCAWKSSENAPWDAGDEKLIFEETSETKRLEIWFSTWSNHLGDDTQYSEKTYNISNVPFPKSKY